jgi:hypothetical protein
MSRYTVETSVAPVRTRYKGLLAGLSVTGCNGRFAGRA